MTKLLCRWFGHKVIKKHWIDEHHNENWSEICKRCGMGGGSCNMIHPVFGYDGEGDVGVTDKFKYLKPENDIEK